MVQEQTVEDGKAGEKRMIAVQVCYATAERQILVDLTVIEGTTLIEAIRLSGIGCESGFAATQSDPGRPRVGIYGKQKPPDTILRDRDRVEIYRPLRADPKEARRRRVEKKREKKGVDVSIAAAGESL